MCIFAKYFQLCKTGIIEMKFKTDIELPSVLLDIPHSEKITLMGSCFSEYIGQQLKKGKFACELNPFGILFNPFSILQGLQRLKENRPFEPKELFFHQGLWHSFMHHGRFSETSIENTLYKINETYSEAAKQYAESHLLILTWGSAYVYRHKTQKTVVANCHKLPATDFERYRISVEEITASYTGFLEGWFASQPNRRVLFTVSPVRHIRDGLHENQLSKSILLLAADALQHRFPGQVFYFPAYELMMDELRDYRFYEADMLHPSSVATEYIYERFSQCCFSPATLQASRECCELSRMLTHRPLYPESENWRNFVKQIEIKIGELQHKYPYLSFNKEIDLCHTL